MGNYEVAVLVGWVIATWAFFSVVFSRPAKFSNLGRSKWRWFLIALLAFMPYFGFIAALFYVFKVRRHFPARPARPSGPRRAYGGSGNTRTSTAGYGSTSTSWSNERPPCSLCSGTGGRQPCYGCSHGWVTESNGATVTHTACGGRGEFVCNQCRGSGRA